jgi:hypothetical protein
VTVASLRFLGEKAWLRARCRRSFIGLFWWVCVTCLACSARVKADAAPAPVAAPRVDGSARFDALEVTPGATCLTQTDLEARLREWLGDRFREQDLRVVVQGDPVDAHQMSFAVWRGQEKRVERHFADAPPACGSMHAVLALAIAIALRHALLEELEVVPAAAEPPKRKKSAFELDAALVLASGFGAGLGVGGEAGTTLDAGPWFSMRLGTLFVHTERQALAQGGGTYRVSLLGVGIEGCLKGDAASRLVLQLCTGPLAGVLLAQGFDFPRSAHDHTSYTAWTGRGVAKLSVSERVGLALGMLGSLPLRPPEFLVRNGAGAVIHREPWTSVAIAVTVGLMFRL